MLQAILKNIFKFYGLKKIEYKPILDKRQVLDALYKMGVTDIDKTEVLTCDFETSFTGDSIAEKLDAGIPRSLESVFGIRVYSDPKAGDEPVYIRVDRYLFRFPKGHGDIEYSESLLFCR